MDSNDLARRIRIHSLHMSSRGGSSHIAAALSIADILAVLYSDFLNVDPCLPCKEDRDRFVLSKGHAGMAVYAVLSEVGFFSSEKLLTYYQNGSDLCGHVSHKAVPGIELSTGSLGHGLGVGAGMALAAKLRQDQHRVVVLLSDGECAEGSNWEAILFASHHQLDNLIAIIDYNKYQALGSIAEILAIEPLRAKWESFGWKVEEINGHEHEAISIKLHQTPFECCKPSVIIAHTTKGKGVSFMEADKILWHYRCPKGDEFDIALRQLENKE